MLASLVSTILVLSLFWGEACPGGDPAVKDSPATIPFSELAMQFRALRTINGHFTGGPWQDDVDRWMGRKHRVMKALRQQIDARGFGRPQLVDQLGAPDRILDENDPMVHTFARDFNFPSENHGHLEILVYHWRGEHDFLYFVAVDEMLVDSGWWHAGE